MNAFLLIVPLFLIRFVVLSLLNKSALSRATLFAPLERNEKTAYYFYQISNILIIIYPFFLKIKTESPFFIISLVVFIIGVIILFISTMDFAKPENNGMNKNGIYNISRNPMYLGYFIYFLGCVLLTRSLILLTLLIIFQVSTHWIILSEERWCLNKFKDEYQVYMSKVRRYL